MIDLIKTLKEMHLAQITGDQETVERLACEINNTEPYDDYLFDGRNRVALTKD